MDAKAKVVAYGLWHESDQRLGNFVHNDIETATYEASQSAKYGYTLLPLVSLTDHEAALAEVVAERDALVKDRDSWFAKCDEALGKLYTERMKTETLITGLEALAGEWKRQEAAHVGDGGSCALDGDTCADELLHTLASTATGEKNTEEEKK